MPIPIDPWGDATTDYVRISCPLCGKPEHGSSACELAPSWEDVTTATLTTYPPKLIGGSGEQGGAR